ncbi:MAG: hypothetical protein JXB14_01125 [Candidatus Altiarchaeota archaeon]|nr:hypothetical protein [Candidatus Altiarchaeota archaeon]
MNPENERILVVGVLVIVAIGVIGWLVMGSQKEPEPKTYCGDGTCQLTESCSSCPNDCGECSPEPIPIKNVGESCTTHRECGSGQCLNGKCVLKTVSYCGDGACLPPETCSDCPEDCGECPSPEPYCGDGKCNGDENCQTCNDDCGSCPEPEYDVAFLVRDSFKDTGDKCMELDNNYYLVEKTGVGDSVCTINFPLDFKTETRDVTFSFGCYGEGTRFDSQDYSIQYGGDSEWMLDGGQEGYGSVSGYFGYGTADEFILSNKGDFGTKIDYVSPQEVQGQISPGSVRLILLLGSAGKGTFNCEATVVSLNPPHREKKSFKVKFT